MKLKVSEHAVTFKKWLTHGDVIDFEALIYEGLDDKSLPGEMNKNQEKQKAKLIEICIVAITEKNGSNLTIDFDFLKNLPRPDFLELYRKSVEILEENNKKKDSLETKKQL